MRALELLVQILGAADEAHRSQAEAVIVEGLVGGGDDRRMVGQAQIVVGAEIQHLAARRHLDMGALRAGDDPLFLEQRILADALDLAGKALAQRFEALGTWRQFQAQTTLPHWPLAIRSKPFWNSSMGM